MVKIELSKEAQLLNEIQSIKDMIEGGLTRRNIKEYRTTYVINMQDSLDTTYPMLVPFNILSEMTNMVSVKVSFWMLPFRAYSKTVPSGGGHTTVSGGGSTTVSGGGSTTVSGGGGTSSTEDTSVVTVNSYTSTGYVTNVGDEGSNGYIMTGINAWGVADYGHTHTVYNHQHATPNHQHATPNHAHAIKDHVHDLTFGIYEEDNSPSIKFSISKDGGLIYGDIVGTYTQNQLEIEISSLVDTIGSKIIKFESNALARLNVQIEIKLDVGK